MRNELCLNCATETSKRFCSNCGQKTDTQRITIGHFITHDLLHGVWHIERGILFTLKEALLRPGQAALDYIGGKRIRYYNIFYLSLLLIAFNLVLSHIYDSFLPKAESITDPNVVDFFSKYLKFILLGIVPIFAFNSWLFFRKLKLNYAEHIIIGGMTLVGILVLSPLLFLSNFLEEYLASVFFGIMQMIMFLIVLSFPVYAYYSAVKKHYSLGAFLFRIFCFYILTVAMLVSGLIVILYWVTNTTSLQLQF
jgi:hypothetical protein